MGQVVFFLNADELEVCSGLDEFCGLEELVRRVGELRCCDDPAPLREIPGPGGEEHDDRLLSCKAVDSPTWFPLGSGDITLSSSSLVSLSACRGMAEV